MHEIGCWAYVWFNIETMKNTNSDTTQLKSNKKKVITLSIFGGVVILLILAFALPLTKSDGTEKFTGKELALAKQTLSNGGPSAGSIQTTIAFKSKVASVSKQDPEKRCGVAATDDGSIYVVEVNKITFFGIEVPSYTERSCVPE